jgi:hypothetical protein
MHRPTAQYRGDSSAHLGPSTRESTEPLEVALVVVGLLALRRRRPGWAAAALAGAVLTRETALIAVLDRMQVGDIHPTRPGGDQAGKGPLRARSDVTGYRKPAGDG